MADHPERAAGPEGPAVDLPDLGELVLEQHVRQLVGHVAGKSALGTQWIGPGPGSLGDQPRLCKVGIWTISTV
jgi:hypothetical protein